MDNLTFVLVSQQKENAFFDVVRDGCFGEAKRLSRESNRNVTCFYRYPDTPDIWAQLKLVQELIQLEKSGTLDGIILVPSSPSSHLTPIINEAAQNQIPVVVINEDIPDSMRLARVATDNYELGRTLGKILLQLKPNGGDYATLKAKGETIDLRGQGLYDYLKHTPWNLIAEKCVPENIELMLDQMEAFPIEEPTLSAIIPLGGWPMYQPDRWISFVDKYRDTLTLVSADALPVQIDLLNSGYVNGLAGQASYQIGSTALQVLYDHHFDPGATLPVDIFVTSVMEFVRVPLVLPPLTVDENHVANLKYLGFSLFGVISMTSFACAAWVWAFRQVRVVQVSQPLFLYMVVVGIFFMGSTLIPLSFDDSTHDLTTEKKATVACMAVPWLAFLGFTIAFSALFAKTWRINKLFNGGSTLTRSRVTERDVLIPFFFLFSANVVVLVAWTILDPLVYQRRAHQGTDGWNRVLSTYGTCRSENFPVPFIVPLSVLNLVLLIFANWQAYNARLIESEFSESAYIGSVMAILLQAVLTGVPLIFLIRELPQAYYVVLVSMIFIVCMAVLLLIFVPKVLAAERFRRQPEHAQASQMQASVRVSQRRTSQRLHQGGLSVRTAGSSAAMSASESSSLAFSSRSAGVGCVYCRNRASFTAYARRSNALSLAVVPASLSISGGDNSSSREQNSGSNDGERTFSNKESSPDSRTDEPPASASLAAVVLAPIGNPFAINVTAKATDVDVGSEEKTEVKPISQMAPTRKTTLSKGQKTRRRPEVSSMVVSALQEAEEMASEAEREASVMP